MTQVTLEVLSIDLITNLAAMLHSYTFHWRVYLVALTLRTSVMNVLLVRFSCADLTENVDLGALNKGETRNMRLSRFSHICTRYFPATTMFEV